LIAGPVSTRIGGVWYRIVTWTLWPLLIATWVGVAIAFGRSAPADLLGAFLGLASLTLIVVLIGLEFLLPFRRDWSLRGDREAWRDAGHYLLYSQIGGTTTNLLFVFGASAMMSRLGLEGGLGVWPTESPVWFQIVLVIVLGDGLEYWTHRLSHSVPAIWPLHAIHHSPVRLSTVKAGRHHVLYFWLRGAIAWLPLMVLGAPAQIILWQVVALGTTGILSHANVDFRLPRWVHRVLVTPHYHRIHHSIDTRQGNSNFAVVMPIWDILFGTFVDPTKTPTPDVGMKDDPIPRSFWRELLVPFTWRRLVRARDRASG
jgi:sterol desaturase/sphingolipid hydroxylase (fatty acid hydroxylase superfamily)